MPEKLVVYKLKYMLPCSCLMITLQELLQKIKAQQPLSNKHGFFPLLHLSLPGRIILNISDLKQSKTSQRKILPSQLTVSDSSSWKQLENDNQLDFAIKTMVLKLRFILKGRKTVSRNLGYHINQVSVPFVLCPTG